MWDEVARYGRYRMKEMGAGYVGKEAEGLMAGKTLEYNRQGIETA